MKLTSLLWLSLLESPPSLLFADCLTPGSPSSRTLVGKGFYQVLNSPGQFVWEGRSDGSYWPGPAHSLRGMTLGSQELSPANIPTNVTLLAPETRVEERVQRKIPMERLSLTSLNKALP